MGSVFNETEP